MLIYFKTYNLIMMSNRRIGSVARLFFFVILMIIIIGSVFMLKTSSITGLASGSKSAESVKTLYELANPGTSFEVVAVTETSGLYKVLLKSVSSSGTVYSDVYVTKDGKFLSPSVILVENSTEQILKTKEFIDCLYDRDVRIFGTLNSSLSPQGAATTSLQLQALGMYSGKIYVSCDGPNLENCIRAGISEVPSVLYNNTLYPGAKDLPWFEQTSRCKF